MSEPQRIGELEIVRRIGAGGFGVVYLAQDHRLGRRVALKVAHPGRGDLWREARAAAKLSHPNVVAIYELGVHEEMPYLVMEYVEGPTLRERLSRGDVPRREALRIARDLAAALGAAHGEGIMHLDLTPSNVLLAADGRARVVDFGLARAAEGFAVDGLASGPLSSVLGTPAYMAPEQWRREPVSTAADIWSLGMILHALAAGELPIDGSIDAIHDAVAGAAELPLDLDPSPLAELVRRCVRKDPTARPAAAEIAAQLAALAGEASPFVGIAPLTAGMRYVGRSALVAEVAEASEPAILITGASGTGKTSFVQAGLSPVLRARGCRVITLSSDLATALHQALPGAATATRNSESEDPPTPERFAAELADAADAVGELVVVVELDALDATAITTLAAAIGDAGAAKIIGISRDRRLATRLGIARVVELPAPTHDELVRMLVEPLRDCEVVLDAALASRLADELVASPGAQALVQLVGTALWNSRRDQRIAGEARVASLLAPQLAAQPRALLTRARSVVEARRIAGADVVDALVAARFLVVDGDRVTPAIEVPMARPSRWRIVAAGAAIAVAVPLVLAGVSSTPSTNAMPAAASQCAPWVFSNATMATAFNDPAIQDSFAGISYDGRTVLTLRRNCNVDELYTPTIVDLDDAGTPITLDLSQTSVKTGFHELEGFVALAPDGLSVIGVLPDTHGFGVSRRSQRGLADFGAIATGEFAALSVSAPLWVRYPIQSADGLALHYTVHSTADRKYNAPMVAERPSRDVPFGAPRLLEDLALNPEGGDAHVTGISADRLTIYIQVGWVTVAHARATVTAPFDNPRKPIGEPPIQGFRTMPVGDCEMLIGTCVGGCMQEDTCFFVR